MKRRRNSNSLAGALAVPLSMIDVAWLVLMFALIQAQFLVESVALPNLVRTEPSRSAGQDKVGSQVALRISGDVTYQGELIALEEVSPRIKSEPDQTRPVLLSIETDDHSPHVELKVDRRQPQPTEFGFQSGAGHLGLQRDRDVGG